jgi:hypothetical protein
MKKVFFWVGKKGEGRISAIYTKNQSCVNLPRSRPGMSTAFEG